MDHLADSTAKLSQGRENWYIDIEGVPVDDSSWEKYEPVIVFECMDLSISFRRPERTCSCSVFFTSFIGQPYSHTYITNVYSGKLLL